MSDGAIAYSAPGGEPRFDRGDDAGFWAIECENVHKAFGSNQILAGLNVGFPDGMVSVLLGPSGTGKSVLVQHLMGLMFPDQGDVRVKGRSVPQMRMSELLAMRTNFGVCFQDGALLGSMSIYDNVAFPLRQHTDLTEAEIAEVVNRRLSAGGARGRRRSGGRANCPGVCASARVSRGRSCSSPR